MQEATQDGKIKSRRACANQMLYLLYYINPDLFEHSCGLVLGIKKLDITGLNWEQRCSKLFYGLAIISLYPLIRDQEKNQIPVLHIDSKSRLHQCC